MSDCREIRTKVLETAAAEARAVAGHLAACPGCTRWLADINRIDAVLARIPELQLPADFEPRMQGAIDREAAAIPDAPAAPGWLAPRFWIPAFAAVVFAVVITASLYFNRPRPVVTQHEFGVALNMALNATESIRGADISLSLPAGVDLAGATRNAAGRNLAWRQDLAAGRTDLSVGLVAFAHGDRRVAVKVCKELECAAGTFTVHAGPEGVRMTWMKSAARGPVRFAFTVGTKQEKEGPEIFISTQEDRS